MAKTASPARTRTRNRSTPPTPHPAILGSFHDPAILWDEASPKRLFPSENSARWFMRVNREALVSEGAVCMHIGRMLVDPVKAAVVAERVALEAMKRRVSAES